MVEHVVESNQAGGRTDDVSSKATTNETALFDNKNAQLGAPKIVLKLKFMSDKIYSSYLINANLAELTNQKQKKKLSANHSKKDAPQDNEIFKSRLAIISNEQADIAHVLSLPRCFVFETIISNASKKPFRFSLRDFSLSYNDKKNVNREQITKRILPYLDYQEYLASFPNYIFMSFPKEFFFQREQKITLKPNQIQKIYLIFPVMPLRVETFDFVFFNQSQINASKIKKTYRNYALRHK